MIIRYSNQLQHVGFSRETGLFKISNRGKFKLEAMVRFHIHTAVVSCSFAIYHPGVFVLFLLFILTFIYIS